MYFSLSILLLPMLLYLILVDQHDESAVKFSLSGFWQSLGFDHEASYPNKAQTTD